MEWEVRNMNLTNRTRTLLNAAFGEIKGTIFIILNCFSAPSWSWIICMACVVSITNCMGHHSLSCHKPHQDEYGFMTDVVHLMDFEILETILILDDKTHFTRSQRIFGYYTGTAPNKGAVNWYWV